MKRILAISLCILTLFLCACQPTPEVEPVPNKGDDVMGEKIHTTPVPKTPSPTSEADPDLTGEPDVTEVPFVIPHIDVPDHWTEEMTVSSNGTKVYIDADIGYIDTAHPVYLIRDAEKLDGPTAKKLLDLFGMGFKWRPVDSTREELLERLEKLMREDDPNTEFDDLPPSDDKKEEAIADILKRLQELDPDTVWEDIKTADDIPSGAAILTDGNREIHTDQTVNSFRIFRYGTDVRTVEQLMIITNQFDENRELGIQKPISELKIPVPEMAKDDAVKFAQRIVKDFGMEDHFELASVTVFQTEKKDSGEVLDVGWRVAFALKTNGGMPLDTFLYDLRGQWVGDYATGDEVVNFKPDKKYEHLHINIANGELIGITWANPQEIISVENPAVELLPFDTIKERIKKKLEYGLSWNDGALEDIHVDNIFLTYLKSEKAGEINEYYYTPMWCFTSYSDVNVPMQEGVTFINAIDGTFVQFQG